MRDRGERAVLFSPSSSVLGATSSRMWVGNRAVQIIILVPCLIDARYFGLGLMTAFTEFMSCYAATLSSLRSPHPLFLALFLSFLLSLLSRTKLSPSPFLSRPEPHLLPFSNKSTGPALIFRSRHRESFFRFDVCSIIRSRGAGPWRV